MAKKPFKPPERILSPSEIADGRFLPTPENESLLESVRENLPVEEEPESLVFLVTRQPGLYATFLGKMIVGSSYKAAALATGQSPQRLSVWLRQGSTDLADNLDTYCSRFLLDCQRAAGLAISDAEQAVFIEDPGKWLARGPAKDFHKGRYWTEGAKQITQEMNEEEDPLDPPPVRQIEHEPEDEEATIELEKAVNVLEEFNIINTPEFVKQAREQYKLKDPDAKT